MRGKAVEAIEGGGDVIVSVRPEQMRLVNGTASGRDNRVEGIIRDTTFLGEASEHTMVGGDKAEPLKLIVAPPRFDLEVDAAVAAEFDVSDAVILRA